MKTIGILGGLGPESTIAYYGHITRTYYKLHQNYTYPDIIIYSLSFREFIDAEYKLPAKVKSAVESLHKAGADFVVAACNSVHIVYDEVHKDIPIPWVSIMDVTARAIKKAGISKIGLLGTIFTMNKNFYAKALAQHGIKTITPSGDEQKRINEIIYGQLVRDIIKDDSRQYVTECIDRLLEKGAEGIVLGCTELPFLIKQSDTSAKIFDTTQIHAQEALELALAT
jgi:aspartate racemase